MSIVLTPRVPRSSYPIFPFGDALVLHRLPLYYKRPIYYCSGSVVKSPVLYSTSRLNPLLYSPIRAAVSCDAIKESFSSPKHRLAL
jgi:hypothetical protein